MNLTKEIEAVFTEHQEISDTELETLLDCLQWMRDDVENGLPADVIHAWSLKIQGIIEFMQAVGKIDDTQYERIRKMLQQIAGENYE